MFICSLSYLLAEGCMKGHSPSSSMLVIISSSHCLVLALHLFQLLSIIILTPDRYTMFWVLLAMKLTVSFYIEVKFISCITVYSTSVDTKMLGVTYKFSIHM